MDFTLKTPTQHFINNQFVDSRSKETFENICPANDESLGSIAKGHAEDVDAAVSAAKMAFDKASWSGLSPKVRADYLKKIADGIMANREYLAKLESMDTGKPYSETYNGDILRSASNFYHFADLVAHQEYASYQSPDGSIHTSLRTPMGVCALITPWNLPLYLETWKIAPALGQGNCVVLKPAELTPLSALALAEIIRDAGVPPGVFNVVQGFGAGAAGQHLVEHPDVRAISFTGETYTGAAIMKSAADGLKKLSFELGGKGASVVFNDADISKAVSCSARAAFRNQGQICLAGSRLLVEKSVKNEFLDLLCQKVEEIKLGHPLDPTTTMGSLVSRGHREKVVSYIEKAKSMGLNILTGGNIPPSFADKGAYLQPTIIDEVPQDSPLIQEEIFGPVLTVQSFDGLDDAMAKLNGTAYGLSCSLWTADFQKAQKAAAMARMGMVWINDWFIRDLHTAFGGMKRSGLGREGGRYSLDFFSEYKTITMPSYFC